MIPVWHQAAQPLSWHLTPAQMKNISTSMLHLDPCVGAAKTWAEDLLRSDSTPGASAAIVLPQTLIGSQVGCDYQSAPSFDARLKSETSQR